MVRTHKTVATQHLNHLDGDVHCRIGADKLYLCGRGGAGASLALVQYRFVNHETCWSISHSHSSSAIFLLVGQSDDTHLP